MRRTFVRLAPERRKSILDAALEEAGSHGPAALNIKVVAERASVPVGSLYQYFGDRDALVRLTSVLASRRLTAVLEFAAPFFRDMPLEQGLSKYLEQSLEWCESEPTLMRIYCTAAYNVAFLREMPAETADDPEALLVSAIARSMRKFSETMLEAAHQRGELRPEIDVEVASRIVNVLMVAVTDALLLPGLNTYYQLYDSCHGPKRMLQAAVAFACRGLLKDGESGHAVPPQLEQKRSPRKRRR